MDDEQILAKGGDENDIAEYAKQNGATDPVNPIQKAHLEGVEMFKKQFINPIGLNEEVRIRRNDWWTMKTQPQEVLAFLTTYGINLLNAVREAGPGEEVIQLQDSDHPFIYDLDEVVWQKEAHNSCRSSYRSAIDEGIKEIRKGGL